MAKRDENVKLRFYRHPGNASRPLLSLTDYVLSVAGYIFVVSVQRRIDRRPQRESFSRDPPILGMNLRFRCSISNDVRMPLHLA
jgi:hypothetical protein